MAALVAAVLSAILHILILNGLPAFQIGSPPPADRVRYRPLQMDPARKPPPPRVEETHRFRPENPNEVRETFGEPTPPSATEVPLPLPDPPEISAGPLRGEQAPMAGPAEAPARARWEPRQEIVQVQKSLYEETVSSLPRRYVEQVSRTPLAPDYVLPADVSEIAAGAAGNGEKGEAQRLVSGISVPRSLGRAYQPGGGGGPPPDLRPIDPPSMLEKPETISTFLAAEQYLSLDVQSFRPPDEPGVTYFQLSISRKGEDILPVVPKDFLILQDCSESMTSWKLLECKAGLRRWVTQLNEQDRFELIGFRDAPQACFGGWVPATQANRDKALAFIDSLRAQGNTDVYASLAAAARMPRDASRPLVTMLVTDGRPTIGTLDSSAIIEQFTRGNANERSMFTFGAGRRVNGFLLDFLSYRNRGDSRVVMDTDRIPSDLADWTAGVARPVLADLRYHFAGIDSSQVFPSSLTDLFLDRPLVIHGRAEAGTTETAFQVVGNNGPTSHDFVFKLDLQQARPGDAEVRTRWIWHRLYELIGQYTAKPDPALLAQIRGLAARYRLDVPYLAELGATPAP